MVAEPFELSKCTVNHFSHAAVIAIDLLSTLLLLDFTFLCSQL